MVGGWFKIGKARASASWTGAMMSAELVPFERLGESELTLWRNWQSREVALHSPFLSPEYIGAVASVHSGVRVAVLTRNRTITGFLSFQYPGRLQQSLG